METDDICLMTESGISNCEEILDCNGMHFQTIVISEAFEARLSLEQYQLMKTTLRDRLGPDVDVLSYKTCAAADWKLTGRKKPMGKRGMPSSNG